MYNEIQDFENISCIFFCEKGFDFMILGHAFEITVVY